MTEKLSCSPRRQLEQQRQQLSGCQSQQQQPRQPQQQQRVSGVCFRFFPALSEEIAQNCIIYGSYKCGIESPGCSPELIRVHCPDSRILHRSGIAGKLHAERSAWSIGNKSKIVA